jgi:site-specific DNA recombinase
MTITASLYARLSVRADESNMSLDGMLSDMTDLCHKNGWDPRYVHKDDGKTGGRRDRDEFRAWLADATESRAQVLVAPAVDRLTREGLNVAASVLDVIEGKDPATGRVVSRPVRLVDLQGIDSEHGASFRMRFVLQAEVAREERERIRARQRTSQRRLINAGRVRGGPAPYGYRIAKSDEHAGYTYAVQEDEAQFIKEAVHRLLQGHSPGRIARWANAEGFKPRRATQWHGSTIRKLLAGNAILGRVTSKGKLVRNEEGEVLQPFPAIITLAEHNALLRKFDNGPGSFGPATKRLYLLSGILHCHACERPMRVGGSKSLRTYRCGTAGDGLLCKDSVSTYMQRVDDAVTGLYLSTYGDEPMYRTRTVVEGVDDLAEIQEAIRECLAEIAESATAEVVGRLQTLQQQRAEAESRPPVQRVLREPTGQTVSEWWEAAHLEDKRDALMNAYGKITLHPGKPGRRPFDVTRLTFERSTEEE